MKIKLKKLTLVNFKGVRNNTINLTDDTFVFGDNATGKTTLFDAFTWLLFGKDSDGRADFEIKTLDDRGHAIPKIDHEVIGVLEIDGKDSEFRRTLKEKWVKKRGFEEVHFEGNETVYFVDDVPLNAGEYKAKISDLIDENIFKLITSPTAFNALKWQERRAYHIEIAGGIEQDEIIKAMEGDAEQKQWLINLLASDKTMSDHKKQIAAQIKLQKDALKMIPTRIDEVERSKPEVPEGGFDAVKDKMHNLCAEDIKITEQINDKSKAVQDTTDEIAKHKTDLFKVNNDIETIERDAHAEAKKVTTVDTSGLDELNNEKARLTNLIEKPKGLIKGNENDITAKRGQWQSINAEVFNPSGAESVCPSCKRELENAEQLMKDLEKNFNEDRQKRLDKINAQGQEIADEKTGYEKHLAELEAELNDVEKKIESFSTPSATETESEAYARITEKNEEVKALYKRHGSLVTKIRELEDSLGKEDPTLKDKSKAISDDITLLRATLAKEEAIKRTDERIEELKEQEKSLSGSIAEVERSLFVLDKYSKASVEALESKISSRFSLVQFKMFEQQINGGESETCICTVEGVPYSDLNTAMKINAGLDIINTLSTHFDVTAPIFVDGRESVVSLIETQTQIINLVVSEDDKELRIA